MLNTVFTLYRVHVDYQYEAFKISSLNLTWMQAYSVSTICVISLSSILTKRVFMNKSFKSIFFNLKYFRQNIQRSSFIESLERPKITKYKIRYDELRKKDLRSFKTINSNYCLQN